MNPSLAVTRLPGEPATDDQAAARALIMRGIAHATKASPTVRAIAARFTEVYDAFRETQQLSPRLALTLAKRDAGRYAEELLAAEARPHA